MTSNENKTNIFVAAKFPIKMKPIKIYNISVHQVPRLKYLGSVITENSKCTTDIKARIIIAKWPFIIKARFSPQINLE